MSQDLRVQVPPRAHFLRQCRQKISIKIKYMINTRQRINIPQKANNLRIIPLGGCEEVGKNMTVFEYGNDIVILDMGLMFPEEDMPGIDYVIPNVEYLKGKEKNIRGVIFSHGHLDHIGSSLDLSLYTRDAICSFVFSRTLVIYINLNKSNY